MTKPDLRKNNNDRYRETYLSSPECIIMVWFVKKIHGQRIFEVASEATCQLKLITQITWKNRNKLAIDNQLFNTDFVQLIWQC